MPRYSQMVHRGDYPQYDGGGEAWCSPTRPTMVLRYYDALPRAPAYSWVRDGYPDPVVAHVARVTYDTAFGGTGNWPFNTAYAAPATGSAFVTRLRSLREAERFIAAGIPLVASVRSASGELRGAPISSTNGHLLVVVGFTRSGDVVVNDPAASSSSGVRRTYDRGQFEDAWLKRYASGSGGSGGLVYVVHDATHPLPDRTAPPTGEPQRGSPAPHRPAGQRPAGRRPTRRRWRGTARGADATASWARATRGDAADAGDAAGARRSGADGRDRGACSGARTTVRRARAGR